MLIVFPLLALAQSFTPRSDFGARLEPQGMLMHGAGQDPAAFLAYSNEMPSGSQPLVYMYYLFLKDLQPNWSDELRAIVLKNPERFLVVQIGLQLAEGASPPNHYEAQVAAGAYDAQIANLITGGTSAIRYHYTHA